MEVILVLEKDNLDTIYVSPQAAARLGASPILSKVGIKY
jgi:hypothetical protein